MNVLAPPTTAEPTRIRSPRISLWVLRLLAALHSVVVAAQPVLAGWYLAGDVDALAVHALNASILTALSLVLLVGALVYWLFGRGRGWPVLAAVVLFVAETLQIGFGYRRELALHIPLGVAIVACALLLVIGVFRQSARRPRRPFRRRRAAA